MYAWIEISRMMMTEMAACGDADRDDGRNRQATDIVKLTVRAVGELEELFLLSLQAIPTEQ